ncbi:MAG TPA: EamA family transporter [Deltaproteobacteria bacterium]|jgi:drug/metabolite transporter (DMT)-like permease|nr:EamA family transporter [Deltaproteobacteria bacterium]HOI06821.1 EamA family transporter [Deltaproteobacteria bacterium]
MSSGVWKGYLSVVCAALLWASCGTAGKALFNDGMDPLVLVQTRATFAPFILIVVLLVWKPSLLKIGVHDIPRYMLLGGVFTALMQLAYFMAISRIQVASAVLIQYLAPVLVAGYSMTFWKERVTPGKLASLLLSIAGCFLVVGGYNLELVSMNRAGILWAFLSAVAFALTTLLSEKMMQRHHTLTSLAYGLGFAACTLNIVHTPLSIFTGTYTSGQWAALAYIVVFGTLAPFGLYLAGVNYIRSTRTIITATLEPISAAFMAFFLLGEALSPLQITGGIAVIAAVVILQLQIEHDELSPHIIRAGRVRQDADGPA